MIKVRKVILFLIILFLISPFRIGDWVLSNYFSLPLGLLVSLIITSIGKKFSFPILVWGGVFSILFLISFFVNSLNYEHVVLKDIVEIIKPVLNSIFIIAGTNIALFFEKRKVEKFILIFSLISVLFSALVFIPFFSNLMNLFKGRVFSEDWSFIHYLRFSGFMGYPSIFGIWLVFVLLMIYYCRQLNLKNTFLFFIIFIGIVLTGSRLALIMLFLLFSFFFIFKDIKWFKLKITKKIILLGTFFFILVVAFFSAIFIYFEFPIFKYFTSIFEKGISESSFGYRISEIFMIFRKFYLIGYGPDNYYLENYHGPVESLYFYYVYKFGIFGFIYILSIVLLFLKTLKRNNSVMVMIYSVWAIFSILIGGFSESIIDEYKSFFIFFIMMGYIIGTSKSSDNSSLTLITSQVTKI